MPLRPSNSASALGPLHIRAWVAISVTAIVAGIAAVALSPAKCAAQTTSGGTSVLNTFDSQTASQQDFLVGTGVKGPYILAWKGIRAGTDAVTRDGAVLQRGVDYTLDAVGGGVTFSVSLTPQQIAKVSYQCDPVSAAPNSLSINIPFAWDLFHNGKSSLTFKTLFQDNPTIAAANETPLLSSLDWVGNTRFLTNSTLTSGLYLDLRGGDWLDRSAVVVAEKSKLKYAEISMLFSRAGDHFLQGSSSGLTPGKEIEEFLTTLHPSSTMSLQTTLRETTALADPTVAGSVATTTRVAGANIALSLPLNTKIQAAANDTAVTSPGAAGANTITTSVKVDSDLPDKTHVAGAFNSVATTPTSAGGSPSAYTQNSSLQVTSKAIDQVTISGSLKSGISPAGVNDSGALSVEATPFAKDKTKKQLAKLKVNAAIQSNLTAAGISNSRSAQVTIPNLPIAQASVTGGVTYSNDPARTQTVGLLDATAKPTKFIELTGGARIRDAYLSDNTPDPNVVNTYKMKFLFGATKMLKLTGSLVSNPEAADGTVNHSAAQSIGIESDLSLFKFTGSLGTEQEYTTSRLTNNLLLGIDFRLTPHDTLTTGWEGHSTLDTALNETSVYRVAFMHKLGSVVDLSLFGSMTQTAVNGVAAASGNLLKAEAKIGLHF